MKRIFAFTILFLALYSKGTFGQATECGSDLLHRRLMNTDSAYREHMLNLEKQIKTIILNQQNPSFPPAEGFVQTSVYTIPVVVHVIHVGEAIGTGSNISDAQVQAAVTGLNNRWRNIIGAGVDVQIEFCLASRDPNGNSTTGINRVNGSGVTNYTASGIDGLGCGVGADENTIKDLSKWPVSDYYNIWVVNSICGGAWAGYAYFPWGAAYDGAVVVASEMKSTSSTLAHELGHGFDLYHTFEGDGGNAYCPVDTSCLDDGDKVCDTPPHKQGDCGSTNPCTVSGIWNNTRYNYMSYCFPSTANGRFTQGQKERQRAAAVVSPRVSLLTSPGCNPVNPNDAGIAEITNPITVTYTSSCSFPDAITPNVRLKNYGTNSLTTVSIKYSLDGSSSSTFSWSGNLSRDSSISIVLPAMSISPGAHYFLAYTAVPNGLADGYLHNDSTDINFTYKYLPPFALANNIVNVTCYGGNNGSAAVTALPQKQIKEDWEGSADWTLVNGAQTNQWLVGTATANGGSKSIYISNNNNSNAYSVTSSSYVHFYKDFTFPAGATNITVTFDWKGFGESGNDFLSVYLVPTTVYPAAGYTIGTGQIGTAYGLQNSFVTTSITGLNGNAGTTKRLVFSWENDGSSGTQTPAAVDNIIVSYTVADTGPYTYSWNTSPVQTSATASNLLAGTYLVTVTSNTSCIATASVTVSQPAQIILTTTQNNVTCNGSGNDGNATVNATGGTLTQTVSTTENWEGSNTWTIVNGSQTNKWIIGTATANGGTKSMYVSNNNSANTYSTGSTSIVHFYKDFTFPAGATNISIRFDWKAYGENGYDYLRVYLMPSPTTVTAGTSNSATYQIGSSQYNIQSTFTSATITGLDANAGSTKRLAFSWINDNSAGNQPPAAIDNIIVSYTTTTTYAYAWNTSPVQTTQTANNLTVGYYRVTVTDATSCSDTTSVHIIQQSPFSASITPNGPTTFCSGGNVLLTATAGDTYLWNNSITTQSITVSATGSFTVTVTTGGCSAIVPAVNVTVNPVSAGGTATASPSPICSGSSSTITLTGYTGTIQWQSSANNISFANISGATSSTYSTPALLSTTYYRAVVTSGVCPGANSVSDTVTVRTAGTNGGAGTWTWTGNISTNWFDYCNWDRFSLPDNQSDVIIPGGTTFEPTITAGTANCKTITIQTTTGALVNVDVTGGGLLQVAQ